MSLTLTQEEIDGGWLLHDGSKTPPPCEFLQFTAYHPEFRYSNPTIPQCWDWATIKAYRPLAVGDMTWPKRTCPAHLFQGRDEVYGNALNRAGGDA